MLHRAVVWGLLEANPAKVGVENPVPRYREMRPFDSWEQLQTLALELGPRFGAIVLFAAATGLRPGEWTTLQVRDIDRDARVIHVRRALRNGRTKVTKTLLSTRTVPLQSVAAELLRDSSRRHPDALVFPAPSGSHFDLHNFRNRYWKPAQLAIGLMPPRRVYDLRHTFATFALRAGVSTFDLSRYMGTSLTMIDRHYGHLALDAREHALRLLDAYAMDACGRPVDTETATATEALNAGTT